MKRWMTAALPVSSRALPTILAMACLMHTGAIFGGLDTKIPSWE